MTKDEIVKELWGKLDMYNGQAKTAINTTLNILKQTMLNGEDIKIRGFGKFIIRSKNSRIGRNPQTGKETEITARKVVTFKASKVLKRSLLE